ncbi:MAG: DMT family transporter [Lachnospiraceae bacterium]
MNISSKKAMLLMTVCAILWSIGGLFIKILPWNPLVISGFRSLIAAGVILIYMKMKKYRFTLSPYVILAGLGLAGTMLLFVVASKLTTSANAIILQSTNPVHIMILSAIFFHVKYRKSEMAAVVVTLLGISLFFFDQLSPGNMLGNCVALLSGITMGIMYLFASRLPDDQSSMSSVLLGHLMAAAVGIAASFFYPTPVNATNIAVILILGIVQLGVPYTLYAIAARNCSPLSCSLIGMIEPLLNPVWVFLFVGERPGFFALVGGGIVLVTVAVWSVISAAEPKRKKLVKSC